MRRGQKGQAMVEYMGLLVIVILAWVGISNGLKKTGFFQKVFGTPWERLTNTIEFGVPSADDRQKLLGNHPAARARHSTKLAKSE